MVNTRLPAIGMTTWLRFLLLVAIACDFALICLRVLLYTPLVRQHNALIYLLEPVALLIIYAGIAFAITTSTSPQRDAAARMSMVVGLLTGVLWIINLALETFSDVAGIPVTAPFLLGAFVLWGVAGFIGARQTGSLSHGVLAAIESAMLCVLLAITFGFLLMYTSLPTLERQLVADPDFLRSHWDDLHAFAIANSFDSAFSHLLGALLVGAVVGIAGSGAGILSRWLRYHRATQPQL
ncbi:MAG: hypothetical protein ACYDAR_19775 [Thermomicrobiales bacterium]